MTASRAGRDASPALNRLHAGLLTAGIMAVAAGFVLVVTAPGPAGYGWFSYTPLSDVSFSPDGILLSPQATAGVAIGIAGMLLLAFCAGHVIGARRRP